MPKVSVIIPVYNVEKYLRECMDSVVNQTLKDIEIICVNDGSPDNSRSILQEYANNDERIKIIDQENQGQGIARNNAIEIATGEYLAFVDPDDWCELEMYEKMYAKAKEFNADLVECTAKKYNEYYKNTKILKHNCYLPQNATFNVLVNKSYLFGAFAAPWNKLYRTTMIKDNNVKFSKGRLGEDQIFATKSRILAKKICLCNLPLYIYRIRVNSSVHRKTMDSFNVYETIEETKKLLISNNLYDELKSAFEKYSKMLCINHRNNVPEDQVENFDKRSKEVLSPENFLLYERYKTDSNNFVENIFSVKNTYNAGIKTKTLTLLGLKFKFIVKNKNLLQNNFTDPVDIVYLWCDASDENWNNKRLQAKEQVRNFNTEATNPCRFKNNDELKYSLRSLEKHASWINKIYIVTDNQIPEWLNTNNPQVQIIDHKEIIPEKYLPTFCSDVIESFLHKIPNLSEHFIYANDDMFFLNDMRRSFFFDNTGRPIARFQKMPNKQRIKESVYLQQIVKMQNLIKSKYKKHIYLEPHHNFDAYTKTICEDAELAFKDDYEICRQNKFRSPSDIQRCLIYYNAIVNNQVVVKQLHGVDSYLPLLKRLKNRILKIRQRDSKCISILCDNYRGALDFYNPKLFCINDTEEATDEHRANAKKFLGELFPEKSVYEKD